MLLTFRDVRISIREPLEHELCASTHACRAHLIGPGLTRLVVIHADVRMCSEAIQHKMCTAEKYKVL